MRSRRAKIVTFAIAAISLFAGCEAIVASGVPAFTCADNDPASCPADQMCATATGQCVLRATSCTVMGCANPRLICDPGTLQCVALTADGSVSPDGTMVVPTDSGGKDVSNTTDGTPGVDGSLQKPYPIGVNCTLPADCQSGLCADSAVLGASYQGKTGSVCTIPCCTSDDCGAAANGLVCIGPGTGGHYCVPAAKLGRTIGAKAGGATCAADGDCRSGKCVGSPKVCADSCCSDANCVGSPAASPAATCRPVDVEGSGHTTYACASFTTVLTTNANCSGPPYNGAYDVCPTGVCDGTFCDPPCCGKASVVSPNNFCDHAALSNGDSFSFANQIGSAGSGAIGAPCSGATPSSANSKCQSYFCDLADGAMTGTCTDVCCVDRDCTAGYVCRPQTGLSHQLRCVKQS